MKIKIKVKTLLLLIFAATLIFIWGIPTATLSIAYLLEDGSDKATLFYEKYAAYPTTSNIKGGFLYADNLIKGFSKYTIFLTGWGGGDDAGPEDMEKARSILEGIMTETPDNNSEKEYYIDSYKMLLDIAIAGGDVEMLHKWISFGQESNDGNLIYTADIYNGFLLHVGKDTEGAKKIIEKYDKTDLADVKLDILKAEIALFNGDYEEAGRIYEKIDNNWMAREKSTFGSAGYYDRRFWFDRVMNDFKGGNVVRGTVTYEGKPMPFVEIYVQAADGSFHMGGESYIGITDENGEFQTLGLKDGLYNIGIGVEGSLLENKVLQRSNHRYVELDGKDGEIDFVFRNTFNVILPEPGKQLQGEEFKVSWDEVGGAAYYTVEPVVFEEPYKKSGGSYRSRAADKNGETKFTGTSAVFNLKMLRNQPVGVSFGGDGLYIEPIAVLGKFLSGAEYPIVVNAYDENNKLITSSLPLRTYYDQIPSITVEGKPTAGEQMILNKDYSGAIEYYESMLKENPDDIDALRYLTRIYGMGWKKDEKNLERAYELGKKYGDITGDKKILLNILYGMDRDEIKENSEIVRLAFIEANDMHDDDYYYFLSKYYIAFDKFEEAREALRNTESVTDDLFYLNMYFGDYMEAAENIKSKNYYLSRLASDKIADTLKDLGNNPPQDSDRQVFNDFLLKLVKGIQHEDGKALYDGAVRQITDINLRTILHEISLERHWDVNY